jgi:hypothetical protein
MRKENIIRSTDYKEVNADYVGVLVDPYAAGGAVIGLQIIPPKKGKSFIIPLDVDAARLVCTSLMKTLIGLSELR